MKQKIKNDKKREIENILKHFLDGFKPPLMVSDVLMIPY